MQSSSLFCISLCFFLFACTCVVPASSSSESSPTIDADELYSTLSFFTSYYTGGESLIGKLPEKRRNYMFVKKYAQLQIQDHRETNTTDLYQVRGYLVIQFPYWYDGDNLQSASAAALPQGAVRFWLQGLWCEKSRQLLMAGSASWVVEGKPILLDAVLDLNYTAEDNPVLHNGYISGSLKSMVRANDPAYFDPFSIFTFPALPDYNYSSLAHVYQGGKLSRDTDVAEGNECWVIKKESLVLDVEECGAERGHCSPLGTGDGSLPLPRLLLFTPIQCSAAERKLRYIATFQDTKYDDQGFGLNSTVIGEASWGHDKNELFGLACRLLDPLNRSADEVRDCTMMLRLRYTSIFTVINEPKLIGRYSSTRRLGNSSYVGYINLAKADGFGIFTPPDVRYEYSKLDRVRRSCPVKKPVKRGRNTYPDVHSDNMRFDLYVENSRGQQIAWAYASPLWVGNDAYKRKNTISDTNASHSNISYLISLSSSSELEFGSQFERLNWSTNGNYEVEMTAEGVYDAETGHLCMVGCRKVEPYGRRSPHFSSDCEILVTLEFPPLTGTRGGPPNGTIISMRAITDPLHFHDMVIYGAGYYVEEAARAIWRMDLEILMVLMSNTLVCVFAALQIYHVRRNSKVASSISLFMLLVLSVGHVILLILNFEDVHLRRYHEEEKAEIGNGGGLEGNEVAVRLSSLVALLLQLRLLQLVWTAKQRDADGERKPGYVLLLLYVVGGYGLLALLSSGTRSVHVWGGLRSYGGLILDGFLLPQVVLNALRGPAEKALSCPFYVGISAVRVAPHAYDLYRAHNYPAFDLKRTYYYANPDGGFYSRAWDMVVPLGIIALAVLIFLQQWRRGRGCRLAF